MNLVPMPKKITPKTGTVSLNDDWKLDAPEELAALECLDDLAFLADNADKTLVLRIDGKIPGDEGYRLYLAPTRITLSAATTTGIIRGVQTLRQLAREGTFGACVIEDAPTLAIRGFHIDFRPKSYRLDYLLSTIDRLAELKFNFLLVEWENKLPFTRRAEVVHPEALTSADIDALKAACAKYAIEIMPLVQTFGHLEFALSVPEHASLREKPDDPSEICPLNDDAVALVKDLVRDVIDAHPDSRFIHLGSDEAFVMGSCPRCRENCAKIGRSAHFVNHMKKIAQLVIDAGKTPVIWNDMLIAHPEAVALLPKQTVMLDWHYHVYGVWSDATPAWQHKGPFTADTLDDAPEVFRREFGRYVAGCHPSDPRKLRSFPYVRYFMDRGFEVIAGPSSCCHQDPGTNPNMAMRVPNCWGSAASAARDDALGCILTSWQVRRHPWEVQWYPIAVCAETSWHPHEGVRDPSTSLGAGDFDARFMRSQHGVVDASIPRWFDALDRPVSEDRCDHYGGWNNAKRNWSGVEIAADLARKDERGELGDEAPQARKGPELVKKATAARDVFRGFVDACGRHDLDARFWLLAAEETIFRVALFDVLKRTYFARKGGGVVDLAGIDAVVTKGDALYARARELWTKLLPPMTLDEEIDIRWTRVRTYLTELPPGD